MLSVSYVKGRGFSSTLSNEFEERRAGRSMVMPPPADRPLTPKQAARRSMLWGRAMDRHRAAHAALAVKVAAEAKIRAAGVNAGKHGGTSRGRGSGRLRLWECECQRPVKVRVGSDLFAAHCDHLRAAVSQGVVRAGILHRKMYTPA